MTKRLSLAVLTTLACLSAAPAFAQSQVCSPSLPPQTLVGNPGPVTGPCRAVSFSTLQAAIVAGGETTVNDTNYTVVSTDSTIVYTALTAARTVTMLAASAYSPGTRLKLFDRSGSSNAARTLSFVPNGADLINGANSTYVAVSSPYTEATAETDGVSKWTVTTSFSTAISPTLTGNWTFAPTTGTAITINPPASSLNLGYKVNQTLSGTWPSGVAAANWINITGDNTDKTSADAFTDFGLYIFHGTGGASAKGSVSSLFVHQNVSADSTTNATGHRDYVGIGSQVDTVANTVFPIQGGGGAAGASIGAAGSGYTNGAQVLTISGGTCTTQPQFNVTVAGNVVTSVNSVATAGSCTVPPVNPAATTGGGGTGATLAVTYNNPIPASLFGYAATVASASGTTNLNAMVGAEIDVQSNVAGVNYLVGWNVAMQGSKQAAVRSVAYEVSATGGAAGWTCGYCFTTQSGGASLATTGTAMSVLEAMSFAKGIDFTNATFSGNAWTSTGASITAVGAANFANAVTVTGAVNSGFSTSDGTVTGILATSALHTHSLAVGPTSNHALVFIANNAEVGSVTETATTAPWILGVAGTRTGSLAFTNTTSGTITVQASAGALGSSVLTLPTATDTLIAKATTDTLTNKTFDTAGAGNVFRINGTAISAVTGTGSAVLATSPTITTATNSGTFTITGGASTSVLVGTGTASTTGTDYYNNPSFFFQQLTNTSNNMAAVDFRTSLGNSAGAIVMRFVSHSSGAAKGNLEFYTTSDGAGGGAGAGMRNAVLDFNGHWRVSSDLAAPTLTSCGTSPTISGTDEMGTVTMGTGSPTGCVMTFKNAYTSAPYCQVTWLATPLASQSFAVSASAITLTQTATSSNVITYFCKARAAG